MIVYNVNIQVKAGDGGAGLVSFRKEKFKPFGGPDGGDGGKGGDVYIVADGGVKDLAQFKRKKYHSAQDGRPGGSNKMHGADAGDLIIKVPPGTLIYKIDSGVEDMLGDLSHDGQMIRVAEGGKGGKGNVHFATATNKAPKTAQTGIHGDEADVILRVRLPVDVAIIGPPNSGKSQFLSALSGANPTVASYPFTTREPILGSVDVNLKRYTWVELPAIVSGAHTGRGLGNEQLNHAVRAGVLVYLIDITSDNRVDEMGALLAEVEIFNQGLDDKRGVLVLNKADLISNQDDLDRAKGEMQVFGLPVFLISAKEKTGLGDLVAEVHRLAAEALPEEEPGLSPPVVFRPRPVDGGRVK